MHNGNGHLMHAGCALYEEEMVRKWRGGFYQRHEKREERG